MNTNTITLDIRCGHCNKKLSEVTPPVTLMIQRIKCPRCGEIVETYIIKPTENHKPKEKPRYNPVTETQIVKPDELKKQIVQDFKDGWKDALNGNTKPISELELEG